MEKEEKKEQEIAEKTAMQKLRERAKLRKPDLSDDDEDGLYNTLNEECDEKDQALGRYKENDEKLKNLFLKDSTASDLLSRLASGENPALVIHELYGDELDALKDNPDAKEDFVKAHQKYLDKLASSKEIETKQEMNMQAFIERINKVAEDNGLEEEEAQSFFEFVMQTFNQLFMLDTKDDIIERLFKAFTYDDDVKAAEQAGSVSAKNEKIKTKKGKEASDALPDLSQGQQAGVSEVAPQITPKILSRDRWKQGFAEAEKNKKK